MNPIAKPPSGYSTAATAALHVKRHTFLLHYSPQEAQALLDELQSTWHLYYKIPDDRKLLYIYNFYKRLSHMLAADYVLLKEGRRWQSEE